MRDARSRRDGTRRGRPQHGRLRPLSGRRGARTAVVALSLLLAPVLGLVLARTAMAAPHEVVVTSSSWSGGNDSNPGNGVCANAAGACTLRAAISEVNALPASFGEVVIRVAASVGAQGSNTPITGSGDPNASANFMRTGAVGFQTSGALFSVTRSNVTIDLDNRLSLNFSGTDAGENAVFFVDAANVQLLNIDQPLSSGTSFIFGPNAHDVVLDGGANGIRSRARTQNWNPERFVIFREGTSDITVRGYDLQGFFNDQASAGLFMFNGFTAASAQSPIRNITIEDIDVVNPPGTAGACGGSSAVGCRARLTSFVGTSHTAADRVRVEGLTFRDIYVQGMNLNSTSAAGSNTGSVSRILDFTGGWGGGTGTGGAPHIRDLTVENSVFANNLGQPQLHRAVIALPPAGRLSGTTRIQGNVFSTTAAGRAAINVPAAAVAQGANSTVPSDIHILDNHFDGFTHAGGAVHVQAAGTVTMQGNSFSRGGGQSNTVNEETVSGTAGQGMIRNRNNTANQNINTWFPTGPAGVLTGPAPAGAVAAEGSTWVDGSPQCVVMLPVQQPTAAPVPGQPVTIDIFWTLSNRAELHLGSVTGVTGSSAQVLVGLPVGEIDLPTAQFPEWMPNAPQSRVTVTNPMTGAVQGSLRVQTHVEGLGQLQSSQFSRTAPLTGNCSPQLTIDQSAGQLDPTMVRHLHYTVTSSIPLEPASLEAADIDLAVVATDATNDAARINARVLSVTEVPGGDGKRFDVVVAVDDSARVTASIAAGRVNTLGGIANLAPASSTDPVITFVNPLTLTPSQLSVVAGARDGGNYRIAVRSGAPLPTSTLSFPASVAQPAGTPTLSGEQTSELVDVVMAEGDVPAGTRAWLHHTVTSGDPLFHELVVPSLHVAMYSTRPHPRVERRAFTDVTDDSTPEAIEATGTPVPSGSRLIYRQPIWFVWTITNISTDDWASVLRDVTVYDTDLRLGPGGDGVIGHVEVLGFGESRKFAERIVLLPGDTRITDLRPGRSTP